jgi:hypothetical protein
MTEVIKLDTWVESAIQDIPRQLAKIAKELADIKAKLK